jgi:hypothetical protein
MTTNSEPHRALMLRQRHESVPDRAGSSSRDRDSDSPAEPEYSGRLIGDCIRCGVGVGDDEWIFGAWDGQDWRFSGRTLPEAQRLAALRPLLCSGCAVRAKYKLIPAPEVESKASSSLLLTDQRRDRDVAVHRSKHRQVADPTTTHKEKT